MNLLKRSRECSCKAALQTSDPQADDKLYLPPLSFRSASSHPACCQRVGFLPRRAVVGGGGSDREDAASSAGHRDRWYPGRRRSPEKHWKEVPRELVAMGKLSWETIPPPASITAGGKNGFFPGGQKRWNFLFNHFNLRNNLFCQNFKRKMSNFKIQWGLTPLLPPHPTPICLGECDYF